jgi:hypothetical protein
VGASVSLTVTVKEQLAVLPLVVATQFTGKLELVAAANDAGAGAAVAAVAV